MATNFIHTGDVITVTAPYTIKSGAGLHVKHIFGIATHDAEKDVDLEVALTGVFRLKTVSAQSLKVGDLVGYDVNQEVVGKILTPAPHYYAIGVCIEDSPKGSTDVVVRLGNYFMIEQGKK